MQNFSNKFFEQQIRIFLGRETIVALIALFVSRIFLSITPILIKLSDDSLGPNLTLFWREAIAFVGFGLIETIFFLRDRFRDRSPSNSNTIQYTRRTFGFLFGIGITATIYMLFWVWALNLTSVTNSTIISAALPLFTILGGWLFFGQFFDFRFLIGALLTIAGALTIGLNDVHQSSGKLYGDIAALLSAVFYALYWLLVEKVREELNTTIILLWRCGLGTIFLMPIVFLSPGNCLPNSWQEWVLVIGIAFLGQVIAQGLTVFSLKKLSAGLVAVSMLLVPILSHIEAEFLFGETVNLTNYLGFFIILIGIYFSLSGKGGIKESS
ncbi:MAG: DMT family transporter [Cyanobacteria bacterium SBLK]|nr:DMT family transporter [Cyanobacteria bacterium SBLK]